MKEHIRRLVQLQKIAFETAEVEALLRSGPEQLETLEREFQEKRAEIGSAKVRHEELVEARTTLEQEITALSERLDSAQQKLMQVTNQQQYSAALNEIDSNRSHLATLREKVDAYTSEIDELQAPAVEAEERIASERASVDAERVKIEAEIARIDVTLAELAKQREEIVDGLPKPFVGRFEQIARARGGIAMAAIAGGACSACQMRIRPQVVNLLRRGDELIACDSCRRILYLPVEDDPVIAQPSVEPDEPQSSKPVESVAPERVEDTSASTGS